MTFKTVAIAGSLRSISYTRFALNITLDEIKKHGGQTELIDLRDYDLLFPKSYDDSNPPGDIVKFKEKVRAADGIILGTPEYHGAYTGIIKNALDLIGRKDIEGKIIGLVGVAGGSIGATNSLNGLRLVARHLHAWVVPQHVSIPRASSVFDDDSGVCLDENIEFRLREMAEMVIKFGLSHKKVKLMNKK